MKALVRAAAIFGLLLGGQAVAEIADLEQGLAEIFRPWSSDASPGCAVGIVRDGAKIAARAVGSADLEHGVPNTNTTVFEAGSASKQFVAAAILLLIQDGRLELTDDVRRYIPELPDYGTVMTVEHLLAHTSGLRDWSEVQLMAGWPRTTKLYTPTDVLDIITRQRSLNYTPGTEFSYTNSGYNLLASVVQRITGKSLAQFTQERIISPLGLSHTQWRDDFQRIVRGRAVAYGKGPSGYRQLMPFENAYGNGGLLTTVDDLLLWNEALSKGLLGAFVTAEIKRPSVLSNGRAIGYARGLFVGTYRNYEEVAHSGATAGYRAWVGRFPQAALSIALLCNASDASPVELAHSVADLILPSRAQLPATAMTEPTAAARAGVYVSQRTGGVISLIADRNQLRMKGGRALAQNPDGTFDLSGDSIEFDSENSFSLHATVDALVTRFSRAKPFSPSISELADYSGAFASDEADTTYVAKVEDGKLTLRAKHHPSVSVRLTPAYADAFEAEGTVVRYNRNRRGRITSFSMIGIRVRDLRFYRTAAASASAKP